ncbi:MAG: hypothetical protein WCK35_11835 [Chloroflexota bacterium]
MITRKYVPALLAFTISALLVLSACREVLPNTVSPELPTNTAMPTTRQTETATPVLSATVAPTETAEPKKEATKTPFVLIPSSTPIPATATEVVFPTSTFIPEASPIVDFEAKKAEALKMVSIKLEKPEDFKNLPVLTEADFNGPVQEMEYWLIDNVLPPSDTRLPQSLLKSCNDATGFCIVSYDHITEADTKIYRGVSAFFVEQDGKKMLRLGVEYGGKGQLIHFNFEDPKWWTDPIRMKTLIAGFNRTEVFMDPIASYGTEKQNWLIAKKGYLHDTDASKAESFSKKTALTNGQFIDEWFKNRKLPNGVDSTVFGVFMFVK